MAGSIDINEILADLIGGLITGSADGGSSE